MTFNTPLSPVTLTGEFVSLEPLADFQHDELVEAVKDGQMWQLWYTAIPKPEEMRQEIARRLELRAKGDMLPFAVRRLDTGKICGMSTYLHIEAKNRRLEIGSTWLNQSAQRTAINTEAKLLLLQHAFEELKCIAVEFRTNFMNMQSRAAIERLGAKQDGILRNAVLQANGLRRDTVVYSIIENEWPVVKQHLRHQLERKSRQA